MACCDAEGRYADFHALWHTFISMVVRSGASAKTAQTLARHSTVQLTLGRYAHVSRHDTAAAVNALPLPRPDRPRTEALAATGTDGAPGPRLDQTGEISGVFLRRKRIR